MATIKAVPSRQIRVDERGDVLEETRRTSTGGDSIFSVRSLEHPTSDWDTLVHLVKCVFDNGLLAMPLAFKNAGLSFGLVATFFIGFICTHCAHILVKTAQGLCRTHRIPSLTYGGVTEAVFRHGPKPLRKFCKMTRRGAEAFIVVSTMGGCSVYIVFVSANIQQLLYAWTGSSVPLRGYIAITSVVLLLLCCIRNLRYLSPLSLISNLLMLCSTAIIVSYFVDCLPHSSNRPHFSSFAQLPAFFSTSVFALVGIGVIMPLENNMKHPTNFIGCFKVLNTGMCIIISLYSAAGFYGYLKYGDAARGSISLNLPQQEPLAQVSKLMVALAVGFGYPLHMYVPVHMCWPALSKRLGCSEIKWSGPIQPEHIFRFCCVLFTACLALAVPKLDALMGLIGAVCLSATGIIFPAIIETVHRHETLGLFKWILAKNITIILFGLLGMLTGVYTSISSIQSTFQ